ncbi:glycoside hydrolase superfamily, partial [Desarmillaria tabescens]
MVVGTTGHLACVACIISICLAPHHAEISWIHEHILLWVIPGRKSHTWPTALIFSQVVDSWRGNQQGLHIGQNLSSLIDSDIQLETLVVSLVVTTCVHIATRVTIILYEFDSGELPDNSAQVHPFRCINIRLIFLLYSIHLSGCTSLTKRASPQGIDVSGYQTSVSFAYIKATEGMTYTSNEFDSQYIGATNAGLIRGAYHFAHPDSSTGAAQAKFFIANGGGWSNDGITLPGALDIECMYNPNGNTCYDMTASAIVAWITDFSNTYQASTG